MSSSLSSSSSVRFQPSQRDVGDGVPTVGSLSLLFMSTITASTGGPGPRDTPSSGPGPRSTSTGGPGPAGGTDGTGGETGPLEVVSGCFFLLLLLNCERRQRAVVLPPGGTGASSLSVTPPTLNSSRTASGTDDETRDSPVDVSTTDGDGPSPSWTELVTVLT